MLAIELDFVAGRYHATPWGRHVNEGAVEWPPSPWRILRSLVAVWHRKADPGEFDEAVLRQLVDKLAGVLPEYRLPVTTAFHSRHYMPLRSGTALVFDAFLQMAAEGREPVIVRWPGVELDERQTALLDFLLDNMAYLGRAESWVSARRLANTGVDVNCFPVSDDELDVSSSGGSLELERVLAPLTRESYRVWMEGFSAGRKAVRGQRGGRGGAAS